jgi:transposase
MASVGSLLVLNPLPSWKKRLLGDDFIQPPWHDLHPARLAIERDLPPALMTLARTIDRFVDRLCLADLVASFSRRGSAAQRPDLMLKAVLFFLHRRRLHSPAAWFLECHDSRVAQWLLRGLRPSRARWYAFRQRCAGFIDSLNQQLLHQAMAEDLLDADVPILDGTFLAANSSRHVLVNHDNLRRRIHHLELAIAADQAAAAALTPVAEAAAKPQGGEDAAGSPPTCPPAEARAESPSLAGHAGPVEPAAIGVNLTVPGVVAGALDQMACGPVAQAAGAVGEAVAGPVVEAAKPPGWLARTARGRQRQQEHYQKAAKELGKRLVHNSKRRKEDRKEEGQVRISLGDPEATLGLDKEKVYRPMYNAQLTSDLKTDFCLGYGVYRGTQDAVTFKSMLARVEYFTGKKVERAMVDAGYATGANLREAESRHLELIAPYQENDYSKKKAGGKGKKQIAKSEFRWDEQKRTYVCPEGREMKYVRTQTKQRGENQEKHQQYRCPGEYCRQCPRQKECTKNPQAGRMVVRGEYEEEVQRHKTRMSSEQAKRLYQKRKEQIERRFADSKEHRGLRKLSMRGEDGARTQVGLTVLAGNIAVYDKLQQRSSGKTPTSPPAADTGRVHTADQQRPPGKASTLPTFLL